MRAYQQFIREGLSHGHRTDYYDLEELPRKVEIEWEAVCEFVLKRFGIKAGLVLDRGRTREVVRIKRIMAWVWRELGGLINQVMAKALGQDPGY